MVRTWAVVVAAQAERPKYEAQARDGAVILSRWEPAGGYQFDEILVDCDLSEIQRCHLHCRLKPGAAMRDMRTGKVIARMV